MKNLRGALFFSAVEKYLSMAISIAVTAIVARLLSPEEVGVFVVSAAIIGVGETLRDFGAGAYIIQAKEVTQENLRTTFTIVVLSSAVVAFSLVLIAPQIAAFYSDWRLEVALRIAAGGILVGALGSPSLALLRREMNFLALAAINLSGLLLSSIVSVSLILSGWGYLSLVLAALASSSAITIAALVYRPKLWIFRPCLMHWRVILSFGSYASGATLLNNLFSTFPQLLLGRLVGFDGAGLYSRAQILCQLPDRAVVGAFQPVILPAFAAHTRAGSDLKGPYLHALSLLTSIQWPALLCLALLAEPVTRLLLGPQWDAAAPIVRLLAIAWLAMAAAPLTYPVLVASGRIRDTLTSSLISLPPSVIILGIAASFGIEVAAASMLVSFPLQVYIALLFVQRQIRFTWTEVLWATRKSVVVALFTAAPSAAYVAVAGFRAEISLMAQLMIVVGCGLGWLAGLRVTQHPLLTELYSALRVIFPKRLAGV